MSSWLTTEWPMSVLQDCLPEVYEKDVTTCKKNVSEPLVVNINPASQPLPPTTENVHNEN